MSQYFEVGEQTLWNPSNSLMEGVIATAIVLVERAGGTVAALSEPPGTDNRDVQVGAGGPAALADPDRLAELAAEHAAAMAW